MKYSVLLIAVVSFATVNSASATHRKHHKPHLQVICDTEGCRPIGKGCKIVMPPSSEGAAILYAGSRERCPQSSAK